MFKLFGKKKPKQVPLEEQLANLEECGIRLAPGVTPEALTLSFERQDFESDPYTLLLTVMGGEAEEEAQAGPHGYPSDDIWHFDTECVEDDGAYVAIAERLRQLAKGDLPLENARDSVDLDEETAVLSFELDGTSYRWDAEVEDDWVDPTVLSRFAELLESRGTGRRFTYIDLGGQDCLLGCATAAERSCLKRKCGLEVDWLE